MKLTVTGRQVDLTEAQRAAIRRCADRVQRALGAAAVSLQVIVTRERTLMLVELTAHARGDHLLHGRASDRRFAVALATAAARVDRQARRLVDRWKSRRKGEEA